MRLLLLTVIGSVTTLALSAADETLKTDRDKASYAIGTSIGRTLKQQGMDIDLKILTDAIQDVLKGKELLLSEEEARNVMTTFQRDSMKRLGEANKQAGDTFLAENKKKEGVKTTASGLQYQIITEGTGTRPATNDRVSVHYRGTLIDGSEFDNSYKRGSPEKFLVTGVVKGWTEALQMMPVGSKWKLFIPAELGYGERGRPRIPANSVLLFDVELIGIEPPQLPAAPAPARVPPPAEKK